MSRKSEKCRTYYLNVGNTHWGVCERHGLRWIFGANMFTSRKRETPADWAWNVAWLDRFRIAHHERDDHRCDGFQRMGWEPQGGQYRYGDDRPDLDTEEVPF